MSRKIKSSSRAILGSKPFSRQKPTPPARYKVLCEALEVRRLLTLVAPALHSDPGAPATLYLDFLGSPAFSWNGEQVHGPGSSTAPIPPFQINGNGTTFTSEEDTEIENIWTVAAAKYAPFNIDVTTVDPGNRTPGKTCTVIVGGSVFDWYEAPGGTPYSGVAAVGGFNTYPLNYCFVWTAGDTWNSSSEYDLVNFIGTDCAHEPGHVFGLQHQHYLNDADANGDEEYYNGNSLESPIMGNGGNESGNNPTIRSTWWYTNEDPYQMSTQPVQDDMAIIASSTNGFGLRSVDYSYSNYLTMAPDADGNVSGYNGVLVQPKQVDPFRFQALGTTASFSINGPAFGDTLAPVASILTTGNEVLANSTNTNMNCSISVSGLVPGQYYFLDVGSSGAIAQGEAGYGNVGEYYITGSLPGVYTVTNTSDAGVGSLRQAILDADAYGGASTISFDIPTGDPNYSNSVFTISPQTPLPTITDPDLTIDGRTETEKNSSISNPYGGPVIYLNGGNQSFAGLTIAASGDIIANMGVDNFAGTASGDGGIVFTGNATQGDIKGCYIGIAPNGISAAGNGIGISTAGELLGSNTINAGIGQTDTTVIGWNKIGILLSGPGDTVDLADVGVTVPISGVSDPTYGGASVPNGTGIEITSSDNTIENSVVSNSTGNGILISGNAIGHELVEGCTIGVYYESESQNLLSGYYPAANGGDGILIENGAEDNQINTDVIAGNTGNGIEISGGSGNIALSNTIGEATHSAEQNGNTVSVNDPNGANGILIESGSTSNFIGGLAASTGNTISGNTGDGIDVADSASSNNVISYNYIGTDAAGDSIGNSTGLLSYGNSEVIEDNLISGNALIGAEIEGNSNTIEYNKLGTNPAGTAAVPNMLAGLLVAGTANTITQDQISGNGVLGSFLGGSGIDLTGNNNTVTLSTIGLNAAGTAALPNIGEGIFVSGSGNTIGGASFATAGNVISGNDAGNGYGIWLDGSTATANNISGDYIGTNSTGTAAVANTDGIVIQGGANDNGVGGLSSGEGNLISGNANDGVLITGAGGSGLYGNTIGVYFHSAELTTSGGYYPLPNGGDGVQITNGANGNEIGISNTDTYSQNLITGNTGNGVEIDGSSGNVIEANVIGEALYKNPLKGGGYIYVNDPNGGAGIYLNDAATNNTFGGSSVSTQGNVISGNDGSGIHIVDDASSGNTIEGNDIGIDTNGNTYANGGGLYIHGDSETITENVISGNSYSGVNLAGVSNTVSHNLIGTNLAGNGADGNAQQGVYITGNSNVVNENTISGNGQQGVMINGSFENTVSGNSIGLDSTYSFEVPNQLQGVLVTGILSTISGNVIGGNIGAGIDLEAQDNTVTSCDIGINISGGAVSNGGDGIYIDSPYNLIGGDSFATAGNVISGNTSGIGAGIYLDTASAFGNTIEGDYIGTNLTGTAAVGNLYGVMVENDASGNFIGSGGVGNVISGNAYYGVLFDTSSFGTVVQSNYIGTNAAGTAAVGNDNGIVAQNSSYGDTVGGLTPGTGNTISGNSNDGIYIGSGSTNITVEGNFIGTNPAGTSAIANNDNGMEISASNNTVGGTSPSARNIISGNAYGIGLSIYGSGVTGNTIEGNYIGTNAAGTASVANEYGVLIELGATGNFVGNASSDVGNVISGNTDDGVLISTSAADNLVTTNYIGTNAAGTAAIANNEGVEVDASNDTIGGTASSARNLISGNVNYGVDIADTGTASDNVEGNYIGVNAAGTSAIANSGGVYVQNGAGGANIYGNLISGNPSFGVSITASSVGSDIQDNLIGTDYTGTQPLTNGFEACQYGIIVSGAPITIGGTSAGQGNTIDYNGTGVEVTSSNAEIADCTIFDNQDGGGVESTGTLAIYNSTLVSNIAGSGGAIYSASGALTIYDSTIFSNLADFYGGGVDVASGTAFLENTIVAQDIAYYGGTDINGAVTSTSSYNLIENGSGLSGISNGVNHNQIGTSASPILPLLAPPANNGGSIETCLPQLSSPVLNAGTGVSFLSTDQRGDPRPTSGAVDIGAVQAEGDTISGAAIYLRLATGTQTLDIYYNNTGTGIPAVTAPLASFPTLSITGTSGNDQLTIDYSNGVPIPSGTGFTYDGLGGTNTLKIIGTSGNDVIGFNASTVTVGSSTATYVDVQNRIVDPLGGSDSLNIASGLTVSFPVAPTGGGILTRTFSSLTLGANSALIVPTATTRKTDRTLLVVQSATFGSEATLDLGGNDADFTSTPLSTLNNLLSTGYNAGSWTGSGIDSSFAATDTTHLSALGVIQNNQSGTPLFTSSKLFDGTVPGTADVLVKYTYYGDANLDGKVDGSDYSRIDNGALNHLTGWFNGDFNYDGTINGSDYTLIDNAYNTQGASLAAELAAPAAVIGKTLSASRGKPVFFPANVFQTSKQITTADSAASNIETLMLKKDVLDGLTDSFQL